jgi:putative endonuclease
MSLSTVERGRITEAMAALYLELRGYRILERNYRFGHLEIDLVVGRGELVVMVEVKYRLHGRAGTAGAAVSPRKQRDLETAAMGWLKHRGRGGSPVRFDVITLESKGEMDRLAIRHLPGAYRASGRYRG